MKLRCALAGAALVLGGVAVATVPAATATAPPVPAVVVMTRAVPTPAGSTVQTWVTDGMCRRQVPPGVVAWLNSQGMVAKTVPYNGLIPAC